MPLQRLDHYNIDTTKPDETHQFYTEVLGAGDGSAVRPDFGFPGMWYLIDGEPLIHVNYIDEDKSGPTGCFNHVAFVGSDFAGTCAHLDAHGIDYRAVEHEHIPLKQIFLKDPNGVRIEINIRGERRRSDA